MCRRENKKEEEEEEEEEKEQQQKEIHLQGLLGAVEEGEIKHEVKIKHAQKCLAVNLVREAGQLDKEQVKKRFEDRDGGGDRDKDRRRSVCGWVGVFTSVLCVDICMYM